MHFAWWLSQYGTPDTVTLGGDDRIPGVDGQAYAFFRAQGLLSRIEVIEPDWATLGRSAGPLRSETMVDVAVTKAQGPKNVRFLALPDRRIPSVGTRHCIGFCKRVGMLGDVR